MTQGNFHILSFSDGGDYLKTGNAYPDPNYFEETYRLLADNILNVISDGNTNMQTSKITELSEQTSIIVYPLIKEKIRYKYKTAD